MFRHFAVFAALLALTWTARAKAVTSAELYTSEGYQYGRFAARIQFAPGSGVVSSFFLWKDRSEVDGVFWNELDFEKLETECRVETNTIFGDPQGIDPERLVLNEDLCGAFHVYAYEWTPEYIAWTVDGIEVRRVTGETAQAFSENTALGMQLRFNVWPGDATFGGPFDPSILPVYQYVDWVEYSSYANGDFQVQWREDFAAGRLPAGWLTGSWDSPKGLSTHSASNVGVVNGVLVLSLTTDEAPGIQGASPPSAEPAAPESTSTSTDTASPAPSDPSLGGDGAASPVGNATETPPQPSSAAEPGCGCRLASSAPRNGIPTMLLLGLVAVLGLRRAERSCRLVGHPLDPDLTSVGPTAERRLRKR